MKMNQEKLDEIIASHGRWLMHETDGQRADLSGTALLNVHLFNANLSNANLSRADIYLASLRSSNLRRANLKYAQLNGVDLTAAELCNADLDGASLRNANLRRANLRNTNLNNVDINGAILCGAETDKTYYQIGCIGSRKGLTTYCVDDDTVLCGCWNGWRGGTLNKFAKRVKNIYGKHGKSPHKQYYTEYMTAIKFFRTMRKLHNKNQESESE